MSNTKYENSNQFKDGLLMDLHPLQTPNTVLTDNLNGTFITYNGNEYSLQNDMGNFKLKYCRLEPKYFPIGTTSYADTIYIVSYNPVDRLVQVGSYPAPVQYNETPASSYKQFWTISEAFIKDIYNSGDPSIETFNVNVSDLYQYQTSVIFSGDEFRLKGGDQFILDYDQLIQNGFETLESKVIFDSGLTQKVDIDYNSSYMDVPWDTPGNVQVSSRLFEIDKIEWNVINSYYTKNACKLVSQIELFIKDLDFIKKIKSSSNILEENLGDYIYLKINAKNNETEVIFNQDTLISEEPDIISPKAQIVNKKISSWMGEFLKISFVVEFELNYDYKKDEDGEWLKNENEEFVPEIRNWSFEIIPVFHTNISILNIGVDEEDSNFKLPGNIHIDTRIAEFKHVVDPSKNPFAVVGNKTFKWFYDDNNWSVLANGFQISEDAGKMWGAYHSCMNIVDESISYNPLDFKSLNWQNIEYLDEGNYKIQIDAPEDDNKFYLVLFKGLEWEPYENLLKLDSSITVLDIEKDPTQSLSESWSYFKKSDTGFELLSGEGITIDDDVYCIKTEDLLEYGEYGYLNKQHLFDTDGMTIKIMCTTDVSSVSGNAELYDNLPFSTIIASLRSGTTISVDIQDESEFNQKLYTESDIYKSDNNYIPINPSKFYSYFQRYSDDNLDFKSFIKNSEVPTGTEVLYGYKNITVNPTVNVASNSTSGILSFLNKQNVVYNDGFKTKILEDDKKCRSWAGFLTNVVVDHTFLFADYLKFYQLKYANFKDSENRKFYTITVDKDGTKGNNFKIQGAFYDWNGSGNYRPYYNSLDINNYRAIRMFYPGVDHNGKYNKLGMCQMDFSILDGWGNEDKTLSGMCQYVSNFHKNVRKELNDNWTEPVLKTNGNYAGECEASSYQTAEVMFCARTLYSDKAQRPSFTNNSGTINIYPNWNKWTDDRYPSDADSDDKGIDIHKMFIAFPLKETMYHSMDKEHWWKVSGCEQHNNPETLSSDNPIAGVGLVGIKDEPYDKTENNLDLYAVWVPNSPDQKWERYCDVKVTIGSEYYDLDDRKDKLVFNVVEIIPEQIKKIGESIKEIYPDIKGNILNTDLDQIVINNIPAEMLIEYDLGDIELLKSIYVGQIDNDKSRISEHPIFKLATVENPSLRFQQYPVAGVYPCDKAGTKDVFDGTKFTAYDKFEVDGTGRVFLKNLNSNDNIYIRKNSNKKVFGYFPYLPYCESWI